MKPDWKDAPDWAKWLAMDEDGEWYWYEREPILRWRIFGVDGGRMRCATVDVGNWRETPEQRPVWIMEPWTAMLYIIILPGIALIAILAAVLMRPDDWD